MEKKDLFTPIKLAGNTIKNRIFMAPMGTGFEEQIGGGRVSTEMIDFYEERAKGDVGLIVSPFAAVDERYFALTLGAYSRNILQGISRLSEVLKVYDCKFLLQLSHFGGKSPRYFTHGRTPIAPSSIESRMYPEKPKEMTIEQIEEIISLYIRSAQWAKDAGCPGVELHGAHGYLINQFISPHSNRRSDEYGGTLEKRMAFLDKIASGVRNTCGKDFILGFKFSGYEALDGGIDTDIAVEVARHIESKGFIDYMHISAFSTTLPGFLDSDYPSVPPIYIESPLVGIAEKIKKNVGIPIVAAAGITEPIYAQGMISSGKADAVMLGRALIAEPYWAKRLKEGSNLKVCIKCNECYKRVLNQQQIKCSLNPYVGEEARYRPFRDGKARKARKVVVIGAGPAGLEAAICAKTRGHKVIVYEKEDRIGGYLNLASVPDFKKEISILLDYYKREVRERDIDIRLNSEIGSREITEQGPDSVILAIGSEPIIPDIEGIESKNSILALEMLKNPDIKIGSHVVMIGAGLVGLEIALYIARKGINVKILDMLDFDDILSGESPGNKYLLIRLLRKEGAELLCGCRATHISGHEISYETSGNIKRLKADSFLHAAGFVSKDKEFEEIENGLRKINSDIEVFKVGYERKDMKIFDAVNQAVNAIWRL